MKQAQAKTDYQQQAIDFLTATGTEFTATYLKHGKHWEDDKDSRDIYEIELKRGRRSYKFNFGQSINDSGFYYQMGKAKHTLPIELMTKPTSELRRYIKTNLNWDFSAVKSDTIHFPIAPTAYDVLACLTKYNPGSFENFCSEFGYDTDSRKAEKTYNAVKEEYMNVCSLFNDTEIEALQEIQ